jgi:hypothetical protein
MTQADRIEEKLDRLLSLMTAPKQKEPSGIDVFKARQMVQQSIREKHSRGNR